MNTITPETLKRIKNASDLKYWHQELNPDSYYFSRKTMQFFGDSMKNYGIKKHSNCIELRRKKPVKCGLYDSAFFDNVTLKRINKE